MENSRVNDDKGLDWMICRLASLRALIKIDAQREKAHCLDLLTFGQRRCSESEAKPPYFADGYTALAYLYMLRTYVANEICIQT